MLFSTPIILIELVKAFQKAGGRGLLVGGSVRDYFLGKPSCTDFDLEVYGLSTKQLLTIATQFGQVAEVGKSFGVFKLCSQTGLSVDILVPRTELKTGNGHRGFEVETNPSLSIKQALARRDFTINAMAADPLTSELYDYYGGQKDAEAKILRVTDPLRFGEDPLRALRAIQLVGRFGLTIEAESLAILQGMVQQVDQLPAERIFREWKKLLVQGEFPRLGLQAAQKIGFLSNAHFSHNESWTDLLKALETMSVTVRQQKVDQSQCLMLMLAVVVCGSGTSAAPILDSLGLKERTIRKEVINLATESLSHFAKNEQVRQLARQLYPATIENMVWLMQAYGHNEAALNLKERAISLGLLKKAQNNVLNGQDLLKLGFKSGPDFNLLINAANFLHDRKGWDNQKVINWLSSHEQKSAVKAIQDLLK